MKKKDIRALAHNNKDFCMTSAKDMAILGEETAWRADLARAKKKAMEEGELLPCWRR